LVSIRKQAWLYQVTLTLIGVLLAERIIALSDGCVPIFRQLGKPGGNRGESPRAPLCFPKFWDAP
jgi:hypothetical protein